jgi:hypothetical protein
MRKHHWQTSGVSLNGQSWTRIDWTESLP